VSLRDNTRYLQNRSLWQKSTTTSRRQKPRAFTFIDGDSLLPTTIDLTKITRSRNAYRVEKSTPSDFVIDFEIGEYEEGLVSFNNESSASFSFATTFSGNPRMVLSSESDVSGTFNVFCLSAISDSFQVGVSTVLSGQIRYRAVYSNTYPCRVSSSFSSSFIVSAGAGVSTGNSPDFAGSFTTGILAPVIESRTTPVFVGDPLVDPIDTNVSVVSFTATNAVSIGNAVGVVSAPISNLSEINYLVVLRYPIIS
jgi:hypothetical protein